MLPNSLLPESWPISIYMYGVMIAVGILFAFGTLFFYAKKKNVEERFVDFIFYNGIASIVLGFGSAALFQATYNYIDNPEKGFNIGSGMTFIGGLIGGVVCFLAIYFIFRKRYTTRLYQVVSALPCSILIGHAFGRIGCFFGGCCYGKPTDSFLGVQFPDLPHKVHPTQLYEAAFLFVMFVICFYLVYKKDFKHNLSLYLVSYGIFRFLIEYVRGDERGELVSVVSPSQFWSIFMVIGGVAVYFFMNWLIKRENKVDE
ncbi:MAG: prolipoprotein diacylglyceryl transferase [Clostridia bacterium]|nr:prolipoprotein diacylglyceryl transferase [Clostridia bacterium]